MKLFCLSNLLISNTEGIPMGIPAIIPATNGLKQLPNYDIPVTVQPDIIKV